MRSGGGGGGAGSVRSRGGGEGSIRFESLKVYLGINQSVQKVLSDAWLRMSSPETLTP